MNTTENLYYKLLNNEYNNIWHDAFDLENGKVYTFSDYDISKLESVGIKAVSNNRVKCPEYSITSNTISNRVWVFKYFDDYFYCGIEKYANSANFDYYKCDTIDGLVQLLQNYETRY